MLNNKKKVVVYLIFGLFVFHFIVMGLYVFRNNGLPQKVVAAINFYINPQFHYNFKVFAPNPPLGRELFVFRMYLKNGQKTKWIEVGTELLYNSYQNRFSSAYNRWKIQNHVGYRLFEVYNQLKWAKLLEGVSEDAAQTYAQKKIVNYPQYVNAAKFCLENSPNYVAITDVDAIEFAYIKQTKQPLVVKFPKYKLP